MNTIVMIENLLDGSQTVYRSDGEALTIPAKASDAQARLNAFCPPAPEPVPQEITRRQAKIALSRAGILTKADAAIEAMPGQAGEEAKIEWADAGMFRRDHPLILALGTGLGLTAAQIDDLFKAAAKIA